MNIPLDEIIFFDCITTHPSTGAATDADSTPTFAVYEEATDTDIGIGGNLTKRTSLTGNYRGTFTLSGANGFEAGKWYSIVGSATVNAIAGKAVLKNFRVVAAEAIAGKPKADVDALLGTAWLAPGTAGTPDVNAKLVGATAQTGGDLKTLIDAKSSQTSVDDLPTNAELSTALATADDAILAVIAALQNLSQANVRTALGLASANLDTQLEDLPTNAELATALGTADDAVLVQVALVKAKTDSLTFTQAGHVDANVQRINDVTILGDGSATPFDV